jgi:hypothetical protein
MTNNDVARVLEVMEQVVADFGPDYVYPTTLFVACTYVRNGRPDCLVGQVLYRMGATIQQLEVNDNGPASVLDDGFIQPFELSDKAWRVLAAAQSVQDTGVSNWGQALEAAREESDK